MTFELIASPLFKAQEEDSQMMCQKLIQMPLNLSSKTIPVLV